MATIEATRHKAGRLLGIVSWSNALRAEDDLLLTESYAQVYDELDREGIAGWSAAGEIPDRVMPHIAALMAFNVSADKSVSNDKFNRILALRNVAKPEIRRLMAPEYQSVEPVEDY